MSELVSRGRGSDRRSRGVSSEKRPPQAPLACAVPPGVVWKDGARQPPPVAGIIGRSGGSIDILAPFAVGFRIRFLKSWWSQVCFASDHDETVTTSVGVVLAR